MNSITLFSWGYYGWGNATQEFIGAADAVERSRGFRPPLFVDVRIRRSGRAEGFKGTAFEDLLPKRHVWMKGLGNQAVADRRRGKIEIAKPEAAADLLDLAVDATQDGRRVIFFCGCPAPMDGKKVGCHRQEVGTLVLREASKRKLKVSIVEWPGGEPEKLEIRVSPAVFKALLAGRTSVPLGKKISLTRFGSLPWGSMATIVCKEGSGTIVTGPAEFQRGQWNLILWEAFQESTIPSSEIKQLSKQLRQRWGLNERRKPTRP